MSILENLLRARASACTLVGMPRRARGNVVAGVYHVTTRSAGPIPMFVDDVDRTDFCNRLARVIRRLEWTCHAFCLMTTHYHLVVAVAHNALQGGMQELNGGYAQEFNGRHGRSGHLRGDRYRAKPVDSDGHMLTAFRYVALNPVEAGLCGHPAEWIWGSYRGCAGIDAGFPFVNNEMIRSYFGGNDASALPFLRTFVEKS